MSKVKLTKKEENELKFITQGYTKVELIKIADAIRNGYEVEPEYKVGDWVYNHADGSVSKVKYVNDKGDLYTDGYSDWMLYNSFRHAAPSEIAEEKERYWWSKHNRGVKEYKKGDVVKSSTQIFEVLRIDESVNYSVKYYNNHGLIDGTRPDDIEIVCFAEDRKDL